MGLACVVLIRSRSDRSFVDCSLHLHYQLRTFSYQKEMEGHRRKSRSLTGVKSVTRTQPFFFRSRTMTRQSHRCSLVLDGKTPRGLCTSYWPIACLYIGTYSFWYLFRSTDPDLQSDLRRVCRTWCMAHAPRTIFLRVPFARHCRAQWAVERSHQIRHSERQIYHLDCKLHFLNTSVYI